MRKKLKGLKDFEKQSEQVINDNQSLEVSLAKLKNTMNIKDIEIKELNMKCRNEVILMEMVEAKNEELE